MGVKNYLYNVATDQRRGILAGVLKVFLWLLSLVYGFMVRILARLGALNPYRLPCKVISIGNITLGGTGKTSLVMCVARKLIQDGRRVAVVSRGYKRYKGVGDEPYMLQEKLPGVPVLVDGNRIRAAHRAVNEFNADTVILDDAFQQWRIKKDLEVVALDTANPFGNRNVLPRGVLREPLSALRRADIFVLTKANLAKGAQELSAYLGKINPRAQIAEAAHTPVDFYELDKKIPLAPEALKGTRAALVSGIGAPDSFEKLVEGLGIEIGFHVRFSDHYHYQEQDIEQVVTSCKKKNIQVLITTEKDAVRLPKGRKAQSQVRILVLRIELRLTKNEQGFNNRLAGLYRA